MRGVRHLGCPMKHIKILLVIVMLTLSLSSGVAIRGQSAGEQSQDKFARLRAWAGKYPSDEQDPSKHFWNLPEIKHPLLKMLGRRGLNRLSGRSVHSVESAVDVRDDYLFAGNCQYHCCPCRSNLLIVNLRDGEMYAIFRDQVGGGSRERVRWVSSKGRNAPLPKELCKYIEMGAPEEGCGK